MQIARPDPNFGILSPNISRATMLMIMIQIGLSEKIGTKFRLEYSNDDNNITKFKSHPM